jgi:Co/Zn/Cd efflux system component
MKSCCGTNLSAIDALRERQVSTLRIVLLINAAMFVVVFAGGLWAKSTAVLADSLDNLGDALTYAVSLYAAYRGARTKAWVALFKGLLILGAGLFVLGMLVYRLMVPELPNHQAMGLIMVLALLANSVCLGLLWKHRHEDINMSSVWHCSRNDIASNVSVFVAAGGVWFFQARWPDLLVGAALALLFLSSAWIVLHGAYEQLRASSRDLGREPA